MDKFTNTLPPKKELEGNLSKLNAEARALKDVITSAESRLVNAEARIAKMEIEEVRLTEDMQKTLADAGDPGSLNRELEKLQKNLNRDRNEAAGLRRLIDDKNDVFDELKPQIAKAEFMVFQEPLFALYDEYNDKASVLAETMKKLFFALTKCTDSARGAGIEFYPPINLTTGRGCVDELPKILINWDENTPHGEKFHFHRAMFLQQIYKEQSSIQQ